MARHRLKNRDFWEVAGRVEKRARALGYSEEAIRRAREIVNVLKDITGNRESMFVASLFVACNELNEPRSPMQIFRDFGTVPATIRKYDEIYKKRGGVRWR